MKNVQFSLLLILTFSLNNIQAQTLEYYISDAGNFNNPPWQILKFDANGENGSVFTKENLGWPQDILFLNDEVLISNLNTGVINRHDPDSGDYLGTFAGGISGPTRMKVGPDTLLYVLQWSGTGHVLRYELDGTFVDQFTDIGVPQSIGLDWDTQGNLYVSSYNGGFVRKYDTEGKSMGQFAGGLSGPTNIIFRPNGDLLVLDYDAGNAKLYDAQGNFKNIFISSLNNPEGIAVLANGNLVIGNSGNGSVKVYDPNGNYLNDLFPPNSLNLLRPNAVLTKVNRPTSVVESVDFNRHVTEKESGKFYLNNLAAHQIDSVLVYNLNGQLVFRNNNTGNLLWDASESSPGYYILQINLIDGTFGSAKVLVKD